MLEADTARSFNAWLELGQEDRDLWRAPGASDRLLQALNRGIASPQALVAPTLAILQGMDPEMWRAAQSGQPIPDLSRIVRLLCTELPLAILSNCLLPSPVAEAILTTLRRLALAQAVNAPGVRPPEAQQDIIAALANQCFLNEYCYWQSAEETLHADLLAQNLRTALEEGEGLDPYLFAVACCYAPPLSAFTADEVAALGDIPRLTGLIEIAVHAPLLEREIAPTIPVLTALHDSISEAVKAMYESNPFPRWVRTDRKEGVPFVEYLKTIATDRNLRAFGNPTNTSALIAGCGTGHQVLRFCDSFPDVSVTAVDLSMASLTYAKRSTDALGVPVRYAQADIAELGHWPEQFDIVECMGVLHHMADPEQGWRNLVARARPGGILRIGLYSFVARSSVREAWRFIAEQRYQPTLEGIRQFRRDVLKIYWGKPVLPTKLLGVVETDDFFSTSMCRDLVFHVHEVQYSMQTIFEMIDSMNLELLGLAFGNQRVAQSYLARYPHDPRFRSRDCILQFETEHPEAFIELIKFTVQKPA